MRRIVKRVGAAILPSCAGCGKPEKACMWAAEPLTPPPEDEAEKSITSATRYRQGFPVGRSRLVVGSQGKHPKDRCSRENSCADLPEARFTKSETRLAGTMRNVAVWQLSSPFERNAVLLVPAVFIALIGLPPLLPASCGHRVGRRTKHQPISSFEMAE